MQIKMQFKYVLSLLLIFLPTTALAASFTLRWQSNPESDISGYNLYYGSSSRSYGPPIPVGNTTSLTVDNLTEGTAYYSTVTAVDRSGNESGYSSEVIATATSSDPAPEIPPTDSNSTPNMEVGDVLVDHTWSRVEFRNSYVAPVVIANSMSYNGQNPSVVRIRNINPHGFDIAVQEYMYLDGLHTKERIGYLVVERGHYELSDGTKLEAGYTSHSDTNVWKNVAFAGSFNSNPAVITSITTFDGQQPVLCRKRNITTAGFELSFQEEENQGYHLPETVSYVAMEPGTGLLSNITFEVRNTGNMMDHNFKRINFNQNHNSNPIFIADIQTFNGSDTATTRWHTKLSNSVLLKVEEEQSKDYEIVHTTEEIGYFVLSEN